MFKEGFQSFEELDVWKKARDLKNEIFQLVKAFPAEEKYRLIDQIVRSSRSVNSQIAEGHGKRTNKDKIKYCTQARGSLSETLNHFIDAFDCSYITTEQLQYYRNRINQVEKILNGYIRYLKSLPPDIS
ncbi:four helix bundle protein [Niastella koreensis]|uniref:S23 ribosomal protein n=2 Tax=Niastella koreensis TaxID=354356 RepID=G8TA52_NIAKG|nr:four helix bundle protein [Niastella koreensis]AEW02424.1 S23 ribosomal protein [Niastella koreensis GR20-10]OQP54800.1 four helix bundle protein [Niastella koreensis]